MVYIDSDHASLALTMALPPPPIPCVPPAPAQKAQAAKKSKPVNVFTNDGSFLERFQRSKKEEEQEKGKQQDILNRKKTFDDRFRNRGKRARPAGEDNDEDSHPASRNGTWPSPSTTSSITDDNSLPAKRTKIESAQAPVQQNSKTN